MMRLRPLPLFPGRTDFLALHIRSLRWEWYCTSFCFRFPLLEDLLFASLFFFRHFLAD